MFKRHLLFFIIILIISSCKSNSQEKISEGKISDEGIFFEYALYFLDKNSVDINVYKENIKRKYLKFKLTDSLPDYNNINETQLYIKEILNVERNFIAPDLEYLKHAGRGLDKKQQEKLQHSKYVLLFDFTCKEKNLANVMAEANQMILDLSKEDEALIWDSETREVFSNQFWEENRIFSSNLIDIRKHMTIHMYRKNDYCRAITLGMLKFGLPEICIENLSCYSNESLESLINLTAQTLLENRNIEKEGELKLSVNLLKNKEFKDFLIQSSYENAKGKASINIVKGKWEEGDPQNRIIEIEFSDENSQIEQNELITTLFGSKDEMSYITHDEKLLEASNKAKLKIPALKEKFLNGLPVGTHLLLKFPFKYEDDNDEWMWVEVVKWNDGSIEGILQNDPYFVKSLKAGQKVSKKINLMFDYILYLPDGTSEGNETGKLIMQQN